MMSFARWVAKYSPTNKEKILVKNPRWHILSLFHVYRAIMLLVMDIYPYTTKKAEGLTPQNPEFYII